MCKKFKNLCIFLCCAIFVIYFNFIITKLFLDLSISLLLMCKWILCCQLFGSSSCIQRYQNLNISRHNLSKTLKYFSRIQNCLMKKSRYLSLKKILITISGLKLPFKKFSQKKQCILMFVCLTVLSVELYLFFADIIIPVSLLLAKFFKFFSFYLFLKENYSKPLETLYY